MKLVWSLAFGVCAIFAWGFTALAKKWKFGPYLPQEDELDDFSKLPILDPTPPVTPPESPITPDPMPTTQEPTQSRLVTLCTIIRDFEGKPGDANYRNNNPGNCRFYAGGYLPKYGNVQRSPGGFAIFPTYELGWEYLLNMVHHRVEMHPTWTFYDFFAHYAPTTDGNQPRHYAEWVASRCGVSPSTMLLKFLAW